MHRENGNEFLQARHLSRIEKGENRPSKENFQLLTKKMGRTLDWIYANTGNRFYRNIIHAAGYDIFDKYAQMG